MIRKSDGPPGSSQLAAPLVLPCGAVLPNRIAKAGMTEQLAHRDGRPSKRLITLYERWARGGAGLLITGNAVVDRRQPTEPYNVVVDDQSDVNALAAWACAAKSGGGRVWLQLNHPGRQVVRIVSRRPVAPSAVKLRYGVGLFARPSELSHQDIVGLIARFADAAKIAEASGFDGVEVHAAHGYLISQFLSPLSNYRTDSWGGTPVNRRRFLIEVVRAIRGAVSPGFAVGVKLNSADFQRGGFTEEESMAVIEALNAEAVDLLQITGGAVELWSDLYGTDARDREAYFADYARRVRSLARMPLMLTGGIRHPRTMRWLLDEGAVDVVGVARALAVLPDLPASALCGQDIDLAPWPPTSRIHALNFALHSPWHGLQIRRMSEGRDPDPNIRLRRVAREMLATNTRWRLGMER